MSNKIERLRNALSMTNTIEIVSIAHEKKCKNKDHDELREISFFLEQLNRRFFDKKVDVTFINDAANI